MKRISHFLAALWLGFFALLAQATTVSQGTTGTYTFNAGESAQITLDPNEQARLSVISSSGVQKYSSALNSTQTIGPFAAGDVLSLTAIRGDVDYTVVAVAASSSGLAATINAAQQSVAATQGVGAYDANGRLYKPDGTGAADTAGVMLAPYPANSTTDSSAAIQAVINAASAACASCPTGVYERVDFPGLTYALANGLEIKSNVWLNFGDAKFKKIAGGSGAIANSMLRTFDSLVGGTTYYGNYDNIRITGGTFDTNGQPCSAQIIRLENVRDLVAEHMRVVHSANAPNWAFQIGGQRIRITNSSVLGGTVTFQDGFHFTHGDSIVASGLYSESGDDALAFGIDSTAATETWDDEALTNVTVSNSVVKATAATAAKFYYGLNTATNMPFAGNLRGKLNGITLRGITGQGGILSNGGIYVVDTTKLTLASSASGTTLTLNANYTGPSDSNCFLIFDTGAARGATFTNGSPTVTVTSSITAGTAVQQVCPSRIKNIDVDANLNVGSASNDGATSFGLFVQGATDLRVRGTLSITDTANGIGFALGSINMLRGGDFQLNCPQLPRGAGLAFYNGSDAVVHDGHFTGTGAYRGAIEQTGFRNLRVHHMTFSEIATGSAAHIVQGVGSGDFSNTFSLDSNAATKAFVPSANTLTWASAPVSGALTGTLNAPFTQTTGVYRFTMSTSGDVRDSYMTQGTTAVTFWQTGTTTPQALTANSGATATYATANSRFYIQQNTNAGQVTWASITGNDIRGQANSTAIDQAWNTTMGQPGTPGPDYLYVNGNRGYIPNTNGSGTLALTFASTLATPLLNGTGGHFTLTLTGNITISAPTGGVMGSRITYTFTQDATGGRTVTWNSVFKFYSAPWSDGSSTANKTTSITFECDASGNWIQVAPNAYVFAPAANDEWFVVDGRAIA